MIHVPREEFERLVFEAIDGLPKEFSEKLKDVVIAIEDNPSSQDIGERKLPPGMLLLGLYHGIPLTRKSPFAGMTMPDQITIFQNPIERICQTPQEIITQVRRTVLHEIAHHFGISDKRLRELGY